MRCLNIGICNRKIARNYGKTPFVINYDLLARNQKLSKAHAEDANAIAEMRKILEIEGLLKAYADRLTYYADSTEHRIYPKNDYSGLNLIRRQCR